MQQEIKTLKKKLCEMATYARKNKRSVINEKDI